MNDLFEFLDSKKITDKDISPSHVSMQPKGKFLIEDSDKRKFYCLYNQHRINNENLSILEIQKNDEIPILVDIDLNKKLEENFEKQKLYLLKDVNFLVNVFQLVLKKIIKNLNEDHLTCFLFEKEPYLCEKNNIKIIKNGFHIQFPKIFMSKKEQELVLYPMVKDELSNNLCNISVDAIDDGIVKGKGTPWFLYGSGKGKKYKPYMLTKAFNKYGEIVDNIYSLLLDYPINNIYMHTEEYVSRHLTEIFSIDISDKEEFLYTVKKEYSIENVEIIKPKKNNYVYSSEDDELIDQLLQLLPPEYCMEYSKWIYIGWILYNIYRGSEEGFNKWDIFSQQCRNKYNYNEILKFWNTMERKNMTIGSLKFLAQKEDPVSYLNIIKNHTQKYYNKALQCEDITHNDVAKLLHLQFDNKYVCENISRNSWYHFDNHIWSPIDDGVNLRNKISEDIVQQYTEQLENIDYSGIKKGNADETKKINKQHQSISSAISHCKSNPYKKNVMNEAKDLFYDSQFKYKINSDKKLFAFKNGVLDLENKHFRDGLPSDYLSLASPINYNSNLNYEHPSVKFVLDFFSKIFPNESIRNYFLDINSYIFLGGNVHKIVQIWCGNGDNGKSITQSIFEKLLGPLCVKLPTSLITGKRTQSSAACPELVRAGNGVRFCFLQEPTKNDILNTGLLKELSGNDTFYCRGLFKDGEEITPQFKLALTCNDPPKVESTQSDQAVWNRLRVIPFESNFTIDAPSNIEEQYKQKKFPIDRQFDKKIPSMLEALIFILIDRYFNHIESGGVIYEPPEVKLATMNYKNKNDYFGAFVEERIEDCETSSLTLIDIYNEFKEWYKDCYPQSKIPNSLDLQDYLSKKWGPSDKKKYLNKKFLY